MNSDYITRSGGYWHDERLPLPSFDRISRDRNPTFNDLIYLNNVSRSLSIFSHRSSLVNTVEGQPASTIGMFKITAPKLFRHC